jgi:hypothetical protein
MQDSNVAQTLPRLVFNADIPGKLERRISMANEVIFDTEEKLTSLFQPDMLLSHQYFATFRTKRLEPEKRLMLGVLEDAVACFHRYVFSRNRRERALVNETEDWIRDENSDYLFSFGNICEVLKLNPEYVRAGLLRWKQKTLTQHQKIRPVNISFSAHETFREHDTNAMIKGLKQPYRQKKMAQLG